MAHKELITKYAKQLSESNQRIIDLEVEVADARSELEKAKAAGVTKQSPDRQKQAANAENGQAKRVGTVGQLFLLQKAKKRVEELEKALKDRGSENEALKQQGNSLQDSAAADTENAVANEVKTLRGELSGYKQRNTALSKELKEIQTENKTLQSANRTTENRLGYMSSKNNELEKCNEKLRADKTKANSRNQQLGRDKNLEIKEVEEQRKQEAIAAEQKVAELQNRLDRERKRTLEAEAMLGPDGKRCKKCSPLVIDLLDGEESDDGQGAPNEDKAKTAAVQ